MTPLSKEQGRRRTPPGLAYRRKVAENCQEGEKRDQHERNVIQTVTASANYYRHGRKPPAPVAAAGLSTSILGVVIEDYKI
jgi:hypothetical protein